MPLRPSEESFFAQLDYLCSIPRKEFDAALARLDRKENRNVRPGWKTTEFWGALLVSVAGVITTIADSSEWAWLGVIAAAIASAGYSLSRGMVKKETT